MISAIQITYLKVWGVELARFHDIPDVGRGRQLEGLLAADAALVLIARQRLAVERDAHVLRYERVESLVVALLRLRSDDGGEALFRPLVERWDFKTSGFRHSGNDVCVYVCVECAGC